MPRSAGPRPFWEARNSATLAGCPSDLIWPAGLDPGVRLVFGSVPAMYRPSVTPGENESLANLIGRVDLDVDTIGGLAGACPITKVRVAAATTRPAATEAVNLIFVHAIIFRVPFTR